jgi:FkbM family methyltransferase
LPRWVRVLARPRQSAYLKLLQATGRNREVTAATFFGVTMTVVLPEPVSSTIWRYGFVEEDVCVFLLSTLRTGGHYLDIGAHLGFFTLLGAQLVGEAGQVLAVEPVPTTLALLRRNTSLCRQVETCACAAFSDDHEIRIFDYGIVLSAFNSTMGIRLPGRRRPPGKTELVVEARRGDRLLAERGWSRVDVIKIDAESSEGPILRGLEQTIAAHRPAVIVEVGDYDVEGSLESRQVVEWFEERGYAPFEARGLSTAPHRKRDRYAYGNLLFVAEERGLE